MFFKFTWNLRFVCVGRLPYYAWGGMITLKLQYNCVPLLDKLNSHLASSTMWSAMNFVREGCQGRPRNCKWSCSQKIPIEKELELESIISLDSGYRKFDLSDFGTIACHNKTLEYLEYDWQSSLWLFCHLLIFDHRHLTRVHFGESLSILCGFLFWIYSTIICEQNQIYKTIA